MRAGKLFHKVRIERQTTAQDAAGQLLDTWTEIATRRASIEPLNGREFFTAATERAEISTRIRLRYDSALAGVKAHDRVVHINCSPNVVYDVHSIINPRERNRELVLMCERT